MTDPFERAQPAGAHHTAGAPSPGGSPPRPKKKKTARNVLFFFLGLFVVAAVVSTLFVAKLASDFDNKTQKIMHAFPEEANRPAAGTSGAMNILLLGSDSRAASLDTGEAGAPSDQRSDTMMWVHIPSDGKNITMMSIMRDTWVDIPGHGEAKINAAMAFGGVPLVVQTLESAFNNRIDHVAIVDFEGFKVMTDALGGVQVGIDEPFTTVDGDFTFNAGNQLLNGVQALAFVRERYAFADGDYQRVRNQQIFLKAVMNTVLSPATLVNPLKISELVNKVSPYLAVDEELTAVKFGHLALSLRDIRSSNVISFTLPTLGTGTSVDGQSIVMRDDAAISAISQALTHDSLMSYLSANGLG